MAVIPRVTVDDRQESDITPDCRHIFASGSVNMATYDAQVDARRPTDWWGGWKTLFVGCAALFALYLVLVAFDYKFAFTVGLDSSTHAFTTHYRALFWGELLSLGAFTGIWYGWIMRTGRALAGQPIPPGEEVRRLGVL